MKKNKRFISILLAVVLLSGGIGILSKIPAYAQPAGITPHQVKNLRNILGIKNKDLLNMTVKELIKYSRDKNIDIQLLLKATIEDSEVDLENSKYIPIEKAEKIALKFINGEIIKSRLDNSKDDSPEYRIIINKDGTRYEIRIDAFTGKIKNIDTVYPYPDNTKPSVKVISVEEAKKIALKEVDGEIIRIKLDDSKDDEDSPEYEVKVRKDGNIYEIEIDAYTGKVNSIEVEYEKSDNSNQPSKVISAEEAKKIALKEVNGKITRIKLDYDDDGTAKYEIKIIKDGVKYELEIDAFTGKVLKNEIDD